MARRHFHSGSLKQSLVLVRQLLEGPEQLVSPQDPGDLPGIVFLHHRDLIYGPVGKAAEGGPERLPRSAGRESGGHDVPDRRALRPPGNDGRLEVRLRDDAKQADSRDS